MKYFEDKYIPNSIEELKKICKMFLTKINFDRVTGETVKKHNTSWPRITDHPKYYRILITGSSGSGKENALFTLFNLTDYQPEIDEVYTFTATGYPT